jgi:type I site-specific restriction endonuclease
VGMIEAKLSSKDIPHGVGQIIDYADAIRTGTAN